jgi:hypothetical protein
VPEVRGAQLTHNAPRRLVLHHSPGRSMVVVCDACLLSARAGMPLAVLQHAAAMRNPARAAYRGPQAARCPVLHLNGAARDPRGVCSGRARSGDASHDGPSPARRSGAAVWRSGAGHDGSAVDEAPADLRSATFVRFRAGEAGADERL